MRADVRARLHHRSVTAAEAVKVAESIAYLDSLGEPVSLDYSPCEDFWTVEISAASGKGGIGTADDLTDAINLAVENDLQ